MVRSPRLSPDSMPIRDVFSWAATALPIILARISAAVANGEGLPGSAAVRKSSTTARSLRPASQAPSRAPAKPAIININNMLIPFVDVLLRLLYRLKCVAIRTKSVTVFFELLFKFPPYRLTDRLL